MTAVGLDPISLELIRSGLDSIVDEMALTLVRTAYSANLKSAMDLSTAFCDAGGRLLAQGLTLPLHLGAIPDAMAAILARYGGAVRPGDVFVLNDPYEGGTHLPDLFVVQPVYLGDDLLGFVCSVAHHTDIGGRVAGGNACDSTEIYQEGLRVPPIRLYDRGEPNEGFLRLLERNVRIPVKVLGDLRGQLAASHIGERGIIELVDRYGRGAVSAAFEELLDYGERLTRAEIARLPDGRYEFADYLDGDGIDPAPIRIQVAVTVAGDQMEVDFSGSAPQVKGAINSVLSFTRSTAYACVRCLLPPNMPTNEGCFRAIRVHAPPGTIVNPLPPAPVAARGLTGFRIANAVMGALAKLAPDRVPACESGGDTGISMGGYDAERRAFVFLEFLFSSWGGRPFADGVDGVSSQVVNFSNYPAEIIENEAPLRIEEYGFIPDSGGPGTYRGGLALVRQYRFLEESGTLQIRSDRAEQGPYGLAGGGAGRVCRNILNPGPAERLLPPKTLLTIRRGDVFRHELAGAGGWGDPFGRDPLAVLADVQNEKVTVDHARKMYGVVLSERTVRVDEAATAALRRQREEVRKG
ncbi:MAG: hydantoinase B/oxoprolinase family protein [Chloroflexi bacterium]|nr:hydantoinase B/oxoprolinase family protein [Chloroflexota bacterium]